MTLPSGVRVLANFSNFVLIAFFFGTGLGLILSRSKRDLSAFGTGCVRLIFGHGSSVKFSYAKFRTAEERPGPDLRRAFRRLAARHLGNVGYNVKHGAAQWPKSLDFLGTKFTAWL